MAQGLGKPVRLVLKPAAQLDYQELKNLWNRKRWLKSIKGVTVHIPCDMA